MTDPADTIDRVLTELDAIIVWSRSTSSRLGYFPALYRKVTKKVKEGIEQRFFDDAARMERLDVIFANRYLSAIDAYRQRKPATDAWMEAFTVAGRWSPIVLQHLLLGMNAHINLDLGIAAARTVSAGELPGLRNDFDRINEILAGLVGDVQAELAQVWPILRFFNRYLGNTETAVINFSMEKARDRAWSVAERLASLSRSEQDTAIVQIDRDVATFAHVIRNPGPVLGTVTRVVRLGELGSISRKIDILT